MLVEVEFTIGSKEYKICRGGKPTVFEIYLNGELLNQDAAAKDYQKYLEDQVLKLNYKSFTQIVILGSASFTPFMQLPAAHRREVIEDLLDIKIFSTMNDVLKEKYGSVKSQIQLLDNEIEVGKAKVRVQHDYIKTLEQDRQKKVEDIQNRISETSADIAKLAVEMGKEQDQVKSLELSIDDAAEKRVKSQEMSSLLKKLSLKIKAQEEHIHFYNEHDVCPTCNQGLEEELKQSAVQTHTLKIEEIKTAIESLTDQVQVIQDRLTEIDDIETNMPLTSAEYPVNPCSAPSIGFQSSAEVPCICSWMLDINRATRSLKSLRKLSR
jgi:DNA repair exonuclease SbcCD ATPase subunit